MSSQVYLGPTDPTIFTKCPSCCAAGRGNKAGQFFGKAFSPREWRRGQACENCNGPLTILYEVKQDD